MRTDDLIHKIARGTTEIITTEDLRVRLKESQKKKRPLRVKAGFDPTAPDLHLGHVVLLRKLRQFQDLGHQVFFIIGDFTAQIGDPSGRDQMRPQMSAPEIARNAKTYEMQVFKILDRRKTQVAFNSAWLAPLRAQQILEFCAYSTVAQMLARADFKKRFNEKKEISLLEFIYPLLQGFDSVHLKADIELGGADQKFNLLMGRQLQEAFHLSPQIVIMTPLLEGTDGVQKMSKSLDNSIGINEPPQEIFGKVMSITDELMWKYYELLTDFDLTQIQSLHPKAAKMKLAGEIVSQFHSPQEAEKAKEDFDKIFRQRQDPQEMPEYSFGPNEVKPIGEVLVEVNLVSSRNEARRLIRQGAVTCEGSRVTSEDWPIQEGILRVGKRRFLRLTRSS